MSRQWPRVGRRQQRHAVAAIHQVTWAVAVPEHLAGMRHDAAQRLGFAPGAGHQLAHEAGEFVRSTCVAPVGRHPDPVRRRAVVGAQPVAQDRALWSSGGTDDEGALAAVRRLDLVEHLTVLDFEPVAAKAERVDDPRRQQQGPPRRHGIAHDDRQHGHLRLPRPLRAAAS
jgi:hypothetical protein